jgi:hypothetical protein
METPFSRKMLPGLPRGVPARNLDSLPRPAYNRGSGHGPEGLPRKEATVLAIPYSRYVVGSLPWYSVLMVSGIFIAYLLGAREEKRIGLPKDSMLDMVLVAVPCGIVGARLYYVLMSLDQFAANPISALYIWEGGIAVYGAIIGGALGVFLFCRVKKRSFSALLDIAAPGLALAQAIGRWGNYFNREAFGPVITNPAWQFFPAGVLISENGARCGTRRRSSTSPRGIWAFSSRCGRSTRR